MLNFVLHLKILILKNIFFNYTGYTFFKNGDAKIQVKVHPASDPELNLLKEDSLLMHTKTQSNEIQEFIAGKLCLYGVSLSVK